MATEPLTYRARKFAIQQACKAIPRGQQQAELNALDWDVLLVLDACRYDALRAVADWPVRKAVSPAAKTTEWLDAAEQTGLFEDTIIAAGNANYTFDRWSLGEESVIDVFSGHWDDRLGIVPPEPVLDAVGRELDADAPVVGHVLPPHGPYIARVDGAWRPAFPDCQVWKRGPTFEEDGISPQVALATGAIDAAQAWQAYRASVASIWAVCTEYIRRWTAAGHRVVVTADHGEAFGRPAELGLYGHPYGCRIPALTHVPIVEIAPGTAPDAPVESATDQLAALGYREAPA